MHPSEPTVSLVVLNWDGRDHLDAALGSLAQLDYPADRLQLILFDNGSRDGSAAHVRARHPRVEVIESPANIGFAEGNNRAAAAARGEWVGFLNNDMRVEPSWLRDLLAGLHQSPRAACLASRILSWDGTRVDFAGGGVNYQGHGFQPGFGRPAGDPGVARRLLFACGGAMLVRRSAWDEVGGFDADYFAYFEDIDLGWRLNLRGHDVWYQPAATAYHHHHATGGRVPAHRLRVLYERNALRTIFKCLGEENLALALPAALLLLNERALLLGNVERASFQSGPPRAGGPPAPAVEKPGALRRVSQVLREEGLGALTSRTRRALGRRLAAGGGALLVDPLAISHYVALSDFTNALEGLGTQREAVQATRRRTDAEIIALAGDFLHPTWDEPRYVEFYSLLNRALGLESRFGGISA